MATLHDRLRELVAPALHIEVTWSDPLFHMPGCRVRDCVRGAGASEMCAEHKSRWQKAKHPDVDWWDGGPPLGPLLVTLEPVPEQLRLELLYGIDRARASNVVTGLNARQMQRLITDLAGTGMTSLLEYDESAWPQPGSKPPAKLRIPLLLHTIDELDALRGRASREVEVTRDRWRLRRLGFTDDRSRIAILFLDAIRQNWLRSAVKEFLLWRMDSERTAYGLQCDAENLIRLSVVLAADDDPAQLDEGAVQRFLDGPPSRERDVAARCLGAFLDFLREHDRLPEIPVDSAECWRQVRTGPPRLPSDLQAQLLAPANLALLEDPGWRLFVKLWLHTGMQIEDVLRIERDCLHLDADGAPHLRYFDRDLGREVAVRVSDDLHLSVVAHQERSASACGLLDDLGQPDATIVSRVLRGWLHHCELRDSNGARIEMSVDKLRFALRNRTPMLVGGYEYSAELVVDIEGRKVTGPPPARGGAALPNGYCRLPATEDCPHPHACLTCERFVTTREFLGLHRDQLTHVERMVQRGHTRGAVRVVEMNRHIAANLTRIISALSPVAAGEPAIRPR